MRWDTTHTRVALVAMLAFGIFTAPLVAEAQGDGKTARIGITVSTDAFHATFLQGLREAGWVQGQNIVVERRTSRGERERIAAIAAELVSLKLDVIVVASPLAIATFKQATSTIPIVGLDLGSDPVSSGFMASLARPGANVTGIFLDLPELGGKQVQYLREAVPGLARVAVLYEPEIGELQLRATEEAARRERLTVHALGVRRADEIRPALERVARERVQALVVLTSPCFQTTAGRSWSSPGSIAYRPSVHS